MFVAEAVDCRDELLLNVRIFRLDFASFSEPQIFFFKLHF